VRPPRERPPRPRATPPQDDVAAFEARLASPQRERYVLRLYVAGASAKSTRAIANIEAICEEHLRGRFELEVVDILEQPVLARGDQILAIPTLIRRLPPPLRRFIGDLSKKEAVLVGLDIRPAAK
jgi:circadian clock protein KaiB